MAAEPNKLTKATMENEENVEAGGKEKEKVTASAQRTPRRRKTIVAKQEEP